RLRPSRIACSPWWTASSASSTSPACRSSKQHRGTDMSRLDAQHASARSGEDADSGVLEQQRRLVAEFGQNRREVPRMRDATGLFERMLCAVLASADWRGSRHRIFEALPHLGPINSFRTLRTVLARLDVRLMPSERRACDLTMAELPCLVVEGDD